MYVDSKIIQAACADQYGGILDIIQSKKSDLEYIIFEEALTPDKLELLNFSQTLLMVEDA
jgi:hypothetical protein